MDKFYLQLNIINIITVTLMWMIGFAVIGAVSAFVRNGLTDEAAE